MSGHNFLDGANKAQNNAVSAAVSEVARVSQINAAARTEIGIKGQSIDMGSYDADGNETRFWRAGDPISDDPAETFPFGGD